MPSKYQMRFRDLIEHRVKTKHQGFDKAKLRAVDPEVEQEDDAPVVDLGVFDSPSLQQTPPTENATTPGATATGLQSPTVRSFE